MIASMNRKNRIIAQLTDFHPPQATTDQLRLQMESRWWKLTQDCTKKWKSRRHNPMPFQNWMVEEEILVFPRFHSSFQKLPKFIDVLLMDKILHHLGWLKPYK